MSTGNEFAKVMCGGGLQESSAVKGREGEDSVRIIFSDDARKVSLKKKKCRWCGLFGRCLDPIRDGINFLFFTEYTTSD